MKIKLDENISVAAKDLLTDFGYDTDTVTDEGMTGASDPQFKTCQAEHRLLVTFDVGFGDVRAYPPADHHGIVLLRLRDQQPQAVLDVLRRFLLSHDLAQLDHCLCVVTDDRVRVRRR
ncbi:MAG: hypothetical protein GEU81_05670 [Nitriliruptorales bacterium]|nr:hypothetical protein [Nitriliruptorales bacterium]